MNFLSINFVHYRFVFAGVGVHLIGVVLAVRYILEDFYEVSKFYHFYHFHVLF